MSVWNLFSFQGAKIKVQLRDGDVVHETVSFLYMVREEARVGTSIHETVRTSRGNECEVVFMWNFFPSKVRKLKSIEGR